MVRLNPQKSMSVDAIKEHLHMEDRWELGAFPISYNGNLALIFNDIINDNGYAWAGKKYNYKVVLLNDFGGYTVMMQTEHSFIGEILVTFHYYDDGYILITSDMVGDFHSLRYSFTGELINRNHIGMDVTRTCVTADGYLAVGYMKEQKEALPAISVFDKNDNPAMEFLDEKASECLDLTMDNAGDFWFHCAPGAALYKFPRKGEVKEYYFPVVGETGILLNGDEDSLQVLLWTEIAYHVMLFYCADGKVETCQLGDLEFDDFDTCSMCGSRMIVKTEDNVLYFYDLADGVTEL